MHSNIYVPVLPAPLPALSPTEHPSLPMSALQETCTNGQVEHRRGNERGKEERGKKRGEKERTLAVKGKNLLVAAALACAHSAPQRAMELGDRRTPCITTSSDIHRPVPETPTKQTLPAG